MAIYLIGDVQGCYASLQKLVDKIAFDPVQDQLWFCGDLVARGEDSLSTLRYVSGLGEAAKTVLGNHDLHLLATYYGVSKANKKDKLDNLLHASDCAQLMEWLRQQPLVLALPDGNGFLSHAGLPPNWSSKKALKMSAFVSQRLQSKKPKKWLRAMYGNLPNHWQHCHSDIEKFRFTVNALTRMRFCYQDGGLEFKSKNSPKANTNKHLQPWFEVHQTLDKLQWVFGHWASLEGRVNADNIYALDTGCVWGGRLTALRWDDKQLFQVNSTK
ncbi:symmetrical bis(5'-nucleosyl)-tetraphosphatase [Thalassotalea ponticola]|uniref:symmetrical bis(5'-nucleosyl)-tetraphosphatase n=1 Tax=Thalassotalea ponticola TaxID=1523392 RepID=UPI0025B4DB8A|nr:symmetrical bis(5'-nucleosyl)-tetraphosphatase [Thalassotalea ponticola]MDN3653614.1 symmetrical bis(5'-nucleosyl)-tetraphosphatase [Thalassotalea ponticola]